MVKRKGSPAKSRKLPGPFKAFIAKYPDLGKAHEAIARAIDRLGPLDRKACELIKVGICVGAGLESALRSHVRRAMEAEVPRQAIEQAILLVMNTVGFPRTVAAWTWAHVQFNRGR